MTYDEIVAQVAEELGISKGMVNRIYRAYWKTVRQYISSLPLKDNLTGEEFSELRTSINVPSLGKFYVSPYRYRKLKSIFHKQLKQDKDAEDKENQTDLHNSDNDSHQV